VKRLAVVLVPWLALCSSTVRAVSGPGGEQALPCRPTIACTADLVAPGDLEIEVGYILRRFDNRALQHSTPVLLKLTLARFVQFQLGTNGGIFASGPVPASYLDDIVAGFKWHLHDQERRIPSLSFSTEVSLPTPAQPIELRTYDLLFTAYVTKDFGRLHADLNFGMNFWRVEQPLLLQPWIALALSTELPRHFTVMAEGYVFGDAAPIALRDSGLLVAVAFTPRSYLVFDLGGDVGLGVARQVSAFVGMTIVPLRLWTGRRLIAGRAL
jgi:hypothetical protein